MKIRRTATFKRNYKTLKKKHYDMKQLEIVLQLLILQDHETLKRKYKDHALQGNLKGLRELHILKDWLLVYKIEQNVVELWLVATGKHDDIFRDSING